MAKVLIKQHSYGGMSSKPTHFMIVHGQGFSHVLESEQIPWRLRRAKQTLGKDEHGKWRTSAAKEHPPALNKALLRILIQDHRRDRQPKSGDDALAFYADNARAARSEASMELTLSGTRFLARIHLCSGRDLISRCQRKKRRGGSQKVAPGFHHHLLCLGVPRTRCSDGRCPPEHLAWLIGSVGGWINVPSASFGHGSLSPWTGLGKLRFRIPHGG